LLLPAKDLKLVTPTAYETLAAPVIQKLNPDR
jgi:hypothetical protein